MNPSLEGYEKGQESELAVNVMTGVYTGRSPKDKFIVMWMRIFHPILVWWTFRNTRMIIIRRLKKPGKLSEDRIERASQIRNFMLSMLFVERIRTE